MGLLAETGAAGELQKEQPDVARLRRCERHDGIRLFLEIEKTDAAILYEHVAREWAAVTETLLMQAAKLLSTKNENLVVGFGLLATELP